MADPYRQSLSAPPPFERTPPTLHQPVRATLAGWLFRNLLRPAWSWRVEAGAAILLAVVWAVLAGSLGRIWGAWRSPHSCSRRRRGLRWLVTAPG
jgi:hypothetical protein